MTSAHLFVYGTLRSDAAGGAHRRLLRGVRLVSRASVAGRLHDAGRYPAAVPSGDPAERVAGELYELDPASADALVASLDRYEGCDPAEPGASLFVRSTTAAATADGRAVEAWIYWYGLPTDGLPRVARGDWVRRR